MKKEWWEDDRPHPNLYPRISHDFKVDYPRKYCYSTHPSLARPIYADKRGEAFKQVSGAFANLWRRYLLARAFGGTLELPYVENILGYKGKDDVAGYFANHIGCWVCGNFYAVPVRWGFQTYQGVHESEHFFDESGNVKEEYTKYCTVWGVREGETSDRWVVVPSLLKEKGPDKIHFNLTVTGVPVPAPWTVGKDRNPDPYSRWWQGFTRHDRPAEEQKLLPKWVESCRDYFDF